MPARFQWRTSAEEWSHRHGPELAERVAEQGLARLAEDERLVFWLWVTDQGMNHSGDLAAAVATHAGYLSDAARLAEALRARVTHAAFSLPQRELERTYFIRCEALGEELRGVWMDTRISRLVEAIALAFRGAPRPRITRHVARGYDDEYVLSEERVRELAALDPEQAWEEVTEKEMRQFQEYFTFSDAEGWRFYLPAHLSYYLRDLQATGSGSFDAVYWACTRRDHIELLTPGQLECLDAFVALANELA